MIDSLFSQAADFIEKGDKVQAIRVMAQLLRQEPDSERGWLWLLQLVDEPEKQMDCLERILKINPENTRARLMMKRLLDEMGKTVWKSKSTQPAGKKNGDLRGVKEKKGKPKAQAKKAAKKIKSATAPVEPTTQKAQSPETPEQAETRRQERLAYHAKPLEIRIIQDEPPTDLLNQLYYQETNGFYDHALYLGGRWITNFDLPKCISSGVLLDKSECELCDFFESRECPIQNEPGLIGEVRVFIGHKNTRLAEHQERMDGLLRALHRELEAHGRPLHYSVIARMIAERYPKFFVSERSVRSALAWHPELFVECGQGVYRSRRRKSQERRQL